MELEKQVCSLGLAKRFKELGVEENSLWCWVKHPADEDVLNNWMLKCDPGYRHTPGWEGCIYSAFTVSELGEMLKIDCIVGINFPFYDYSSKQWRGELDEVFGPTKIFFEATEADVRTKMLIYLLENNLIKGVK